MSARIVPFPSPAPFDFQERLFNLACASVRQRAKGRLTEEIVRQIARDICIGVPLLQSLELCKLADAPLPVEPMETQP